MTTMPPATLASRAASPGEAPAASATVKVLMTVSPAPVTSAIWSRPVNGDERDRAVPLEERHAATAARHEEQPGVEALEHRPAGLVERALVVERHARQGLHLGLVRRGPGGPAEARQIVAAVHDDGQVPRAGQLEDQLEDPGRHRAVAIVRDQEGLGPGALGLEALDEVSLGIRCETGLRLPVESHHLLARGLIPPAMMRVFTGVGRSGTRMSPAVDMPARRNKASTSSPALSVPRRPTATASAPSAWTLWAALAAPPSRTSRSLKRRMRTGASREIRAGLP